MVDFCPLLTIYFMKFINIGPAYIRGWAGGAQVGVGAGKSLNKEARGHKE